MKKYTETEEIIDLLKKQRDYHKKSLLYLNYDTLYVIL